MKLVVYTIFLIVCLMFFSCNNSNRNTVYKKHVNIDTANSFKLDSQWVTPKKFFKFNSLGKSEGDTVEFVTCSEYVYSPFGKIENKKELKSSLLNNFSIVSRTDKTDVGSEEFQILNLKSSKLIFFFDNDPEASKHSNILKGEINDNEVKLDRTVKVGMTIEKFYQTFFNYFPEELKTNIK